MVDWKLSRFQGRPAYNAGKPKHCVSKLEAVLRRTCQAIKCILLIHRLTINSALI